MLASVAGLVVAAVHYDVVGSHVWRLTWVLGWGWLWWFLHWIAVLIAALVAGIAADSFLGRVRPDDQSIVESDDMFYILMTIIVGAAAVFLLARLNL